MTASSLLVLTAAASTLVFASNALAQDVRATPTYSGDTGLFHMSSAYTLGPGKFSFQMFRDNLDRDPKDEDISTLGVAIGFGVTNRLELFANLDLQKRIDADALFQPGRVNDYPFVATPWEAGRGDLRVGFKFKALDDQQGAPVALAVRGSVQFPTADRDRGLGTGKTSWRGDLVGSKSLGDRAQIHGSIGFQANGDPDTPVSIDLADVLRWAVGFNVPSSSAIQVQGELVGTRYVGGSNSVVSRTGALMTNAFDVGLDPRIDSFGIGPQTNPLDLVIGPVIWIKGLFIRAAISWNLNFDDRGLNSSSKSWTGRHIAIGYSARQLSRRPRLPTTGTPPRVTCRPESGNTIKMGQKVLLFATDTDADRTLQYEWSTSAGCVRPNGREATFYACDVAGRVVVRVTVADQAGKTGHSDCELEVESPAVIAGPLDVSRPFVLFNYRQKASGPGFCGPDEILFELTKRIESSTCKGTVEQSRDGAQTLEIRCLMDAASPVRYYYLGNIWVERLRADGPDYRLLGLAYAGQTVGTARVVDPTAESEMGGSVGQLSTLIKTLLKECEG